MTRRPGHLQQRGPDSWRFHFSVDGQRQQPVTLHGTRKEAERQAALLYAEALKGKRPARADWTVGDLLEAWLKDKLPTMRAENTKNRYADAVHRCWIPAIGAVRLRDYSSRDLLPVKAAWLATLAPSTVRLRWEPLIQAERWAVKHGYMPDVVATLVDLPPVSAPVARRYSLDEALRLDEVLEPPYGLVVAFGLWAGLRIGEARGVRRQDIDAHARLLFVRQQLLRYEDKQDRSVVGPPKRNSVRTVEVNAQLERHIVAHREWLDEWKVARLDDLLVVALTGAPLDTATIYHALRRFQAEADVPQLRFHDLRHTYAVLSREAGIPDLEIAASLGHTSTHMLVRLYGNHPDPARHARMASRMDALVASRDAGQEAK